MDIEIPHNFIPRKYQLPLLQALSGGTKRAIAVWHRRAGKDKTAINHMVKSMIERVGIYYYFLPTYQQGKKIVWDGIDGSGFKMIDHFPKGIVKKKNEAEMKIELVNGSLFQIIGTDNFDTIRGTNPVGCVFSEYSFQDPQVWDLIRPILRENGGWAIFVFTPNGENHGFDLYSMAHNNPNWFCQKLTVEDTGVISKEDIETERLEGMSEEMIQQEYYVSFGGMMQGAYYAQQYQEALESGRITSVPYQKDVPVDTWWDLGVADATAIWFSQTVGREFHIIDYLEESGEGLPYYIKLLRDKGYIYGSHNAPHDIGVREFSSGLSRIETARKLGINFNIVPNLRIQDGINAVRVMFNQFWFDKEKCSVGLRAIRNYHKKYDSKRKVFQNRPNHDWSSHACMIGETLVQTISGNKMIKDVKKGDFVLLPSGKAKVLESRLVKKTNKLIKIYTSNNNEITVTPDHYIFTYRGLVRADALRYNDVLITNNSTLCDQKSLSSMDSNLGFRENIIERITTLQKDHQTFIEQSGSIIMERFQVVFTYIIKTLIHLITTLKTLSLKELKNIYQYTPKEVYGLVVRKTLSILKMLGNLLKSGIKVKKEKYGIKNIPKNLGLIKNGIINYVKSVVENIEHHFLQGQNTVVRIVRLQRLEEGEEWKNVYDLTIEKDHCYMANGILVSNCDGLRYMALGIRQAHPTRINISKEDKDFYRMIRRKKNRTKNSGGYNLRMS